MRKFQVNLPFEVQVLNPADMVGDGLIHIHQRLAGTLEAPDRETAIAHCEDVIRQQFVGCWSLSFHVNRYQVAEVEHGPASS